MNLNKFLFGLLFISSLFATNLNAQQLDFELKYNGATSLYEVFATPNFTDANYFVGGGSQLSIVLPQDIADLPLEINTFAGGIWTDNSRIFAPATDNIHDFHGIASSGAVISFVENQSVLLFSFELPGGDCRSDVRLYDNLIDPDSSELGMSESDFRNFFANVFNPFKNNWNTNRNSVDPECIHAPSAASSSLTVVENTSGTICIPIDDPNAGDVFQIEFCNGFVQSENGFAAISIVGNELCVEYTPAIDVTGTDEVCVTICDQTGLCNSAMVGIVIIPTPDYSEVTAVSQECQNVLDWTIYDPSQFDYFEVERSSDGTTFEFLETFQSNGLTDEMTFSFLDEQASEDYQYRLKLVFLNGDFNFSDPIMVNSNCNIGVGSTAAASILAEANYCENKISWRINNHTDLLYYELERSFNSNEFEVLRRFDVSVQTEIISDLFLDDKTLGDHQYRLKIVMKDNVISYSNATLAKSQCELEDGFVIYPNPASSNTEMVNIKFYSETETVVIGITDPLGRIVDSQSFATTRGLNTVSIDISKLANGAYFCSLRGKETITKPFMKIDTRD